MVNFFTKIFGSNKLAKGESQAQDLIEERIEGLIENGRFDLSFETEMVSNEHGRKCHNNIAQMSPQITL